MSESDDSVFVLHDYVKSVSDDNTKSRVTVKVNGVDVNMIIDTGSSVNVIDSVTYRKLECPKLYK